MICGAIEKHLLTYTLPVKQAENGKSGLTETGKASCCLGKYLDENSSIIGTRSVKWFDFDEPTSVYVLTDIRSKIQLIAT